jgi:hypothetical protein
MRPLVRDQLNQSAPGQLADRKLELDSRQAAEYLTDQLFNQMDK